MNKNQLLSVAAILLFVLGIIMIFLGISASILPPTLTGIGFFLIGIVFLTTRTK